MLDVPATLLAAIGHQQAAHYAEAEALYRAVLVDAPDDPRAVYLYGLLQLGTGQTAAAVGSLGRAVLLRPSHVAVRLGLGRALLAEGHYAEALAAADIVLRQDPDNAQALFLRGTALSALDQPADAVAVLRRAIAADPANAAAHLNLGNALADLDELEAAEAAICRAIALDPTLVEAHVSLGFVLTSRGRLTEAVAACEAALILRPDMAQAHWNLAIAALLAGDFVRGFDEYEWRKRHDRFRHDFIDLPGPVWTGDDPAGRTVMVHAEQGFGDTIQLARYLTPIAMRGAWVVLACDRRLVSLLGTLPGVTTVAVDGTLPPYDAWIDQMSLPRVFATGPTTIPAAGGYLTPDPVREAAWWTALPPGPKVGVAWGGNPNHSNDRRRSLPAASVAALLAAPGIRFISLQLGPRASEAELPDLSARLPDYAETAALIANLDLVVTVDTSVAHLAGALGVPCWVMLPFAPDWRWRLGREDTDWYSSLRLFRQPTPGAWRDVVAQVVAELGVWRDARPAFDRTIATGHPRTSAREAASQPITSANAAWLGSHPCALT
jgi:cytochrome c-type biogenesis protein CcmH/NrfG